MPLCDCQVATADQAETDRYWNAIVGNGGEDSACGCGKDKWGLSSFERGCKEETVPPAPTLVRNIEKTYDDPLSLVWIRAAEQMGIRIERSDEVNASWNGDGVLTIGAPETLDPDDCLAQMILHEICHALCEGPESLHQLDWGLESSDPAKKVHEHACLRLQAALADRYGMRSFFASTTMFRSYYDRLPAEPLAAGDDPAIAQAKAGWERAHNGRWAAALLDALDRTAQIARALHGLTTDDSLWHAQGATD